MVQGLPVDVYLIYAFVGFVTFIVCAILFNRVRSSKNRGLIDKTYCGLLIFFMAFALVDAFWGLLGSTVVFKTNHATAFLVFTFFFHTMAALSAFVWAQYILVFLKLGDKIKWACRIATIVLLCAQITMIIQNAFTWNAFGVNPDGTYTTHPLRPILFCLQFAYYVLILFASAIRVGFGKKKGYKHRTRYALSSVLYSLIILVSGILQMLYPDAPFYTIGFLISAITIYAFNVTYQREKMIYTFYEERSSKLTTLLNTLSQSYDAIYYVDIETDSYENFAQNDKEIGEITGNGNFFIDLVQSASVQVHPDDRQYFIEKMKKQTILSALDEKDIYNVEFRLLVGQEYRYYILRCKLTTDNEGKKKLIIGVYDQDNKIKEKIQENEKLQTAMDEALVANRAKTSFLFNMSHDIRTPMNAIIGFTDMAKKHKGEQDKVDHCLEKVTMASNHLLSLINDVLDMARIESGKVTIDEKAISIEDETNNIHDLMKATADKKNIRFTSTCIVDDKLIFADQLRLGRVIMNVLSNAIKYTNEGGRINHVVTQLASSDRDKVKLQIVVSDNGIGMSEEFLSHLFEAFSREKSSTVSSIQGTGLGMAITKELTELMGGTIDVQSELGNGTTVTLVFEFRKADSLDMKDTSEAEIDPSFIKGKRILLVEDNELNREIANDILADYGVILDEANDGTVAIKQVADSIKDDKEYDVILMDIQMPIMDGYSATSEIRALQIGHKRTPIIAMTANAFDEDKKRALDAGMDAHVAKPISINDLLATMSQLLN